MAFKMTARNRRRYIELMNYTQHSFRIDITCFWSTRLSHPATYLLNSNFQTRLLTPTIVKAVLHIHKPYNLSPGWFLYNPWQTSTHIVSSFNIFQGNQNINYLFRPFTWSRSNSSIKVVPHKLTAGLVTSTKNHSIYRLWRLEYSQQSSCSVWSVRYCLEREQ